MARTVGPRDLADFPKDYSSPEDSDVGRLFDQKGLRQQLEQDLRVRPLQPGVELWD